MRVRQCLRNRKNHCLCGAFAAYLGAAQAKRKATRFGVDFLRLPTSSQIEKAYWLGWLGRAAILQSGKNASQSILAICPLVALLFGLK